MAKNSKKIKILYILWSLIRKISIVFLYLYTSQLLASNNLKEN